MIEVDMVDELWQKLGVEIEGSGLLVLNRKGTLQGLEIVVEVVRGLSFSLSSVLNLLGYRRSLVG
jgi:hypothetical protein